MKHFQCLRHERRDIFAVSADNKKCADNKNCRTALYHHVVIFKSKLKISHGYFQNSTHVAQLPININENMEETRGIARNREEEREQRQQKLIVMKSEKSC